MEHFASLLAQKWALHFLYYQEMLEKFAYFITDGHYGATVAGVDGKESRTLGDYVMEAAMQIVFFTGTTVEIQPTVDPTNKAEVIDMLRRARRAFCKHAAGLSTDHASRPRSTALDDSDSTYVEEVVVLIGHVNRLLGQAMTVAEAHGQKFLLSQLDTYPSFYQTDETVPGRDVPPPLK